MDEFFKKLENAKWLGWIAFSLIPIAAVVGMLNGLVGEGLQILLVYGSFFLGIAAGQLLCKFAMRLLGKEGSNLEFRLSYGLSCFGSILLPRLVFAWSDTLLGRNVDEGFISKAVWAACFGGVVFFIFASPKTND
jgi:hypothetical protein